MKWNGRSYRPANAQFYAKKKPFDFEEALKPYGEKEMPVWNSVVGVNVPPTSEPEPTPSPTPSITPTNTLTATPSNTPSNTPSTTPSNTPSITPTNTPSVTPSITATNTPTPSITPSTSVIPSGTTEANLYLETVATAKGSALGSTISAATVSLFTSLVSNGLWDKLYAFYPMIGSTDATCAINGKIPGEKSIVWNGGWTFNASGATPNGVNAYGNPSVNISVATSQNSSHISFYGVGGAATFGLDFGGGIPSSSPFPFLGVGVMEFTSPNYAAGIRVNASSATWTYYNQLTNYNGRGFVIGSRTTSTAQRLYFNGVLRTTTTIGSVAPPNLNAYIGARNNAGVADVFSNKQCAFATIGSGLDDTEAGNLSTIINTFQTSLGRNVY